MQEAYHLPHNKCSLCCSVLGRGTPVLLAGGVPQSCPGRVLSKSCPGQGVPLYPRDWSTSTWDWSTLCTGILCLGQGYSQLGLGYPPSPIKVLSGLAYFWERTLDQRPEKNLGLGYPPERPWDERLGWDLGPETWVPLLLNRYNSSYIPTLNKILE